VFDAYVRTSALDVAQLQPRHCFSEIDSEEDLEQFEWPNALTGTTEWIIPSTRTITLAWEWSYDENSRRVQADWDSLRTNLMITHQNGIDQGRAITQWMVEALMHKVRWDAQVLDAVLPSSKH
jgi:Domain of unknown function (DUF4902)